MFLPSREKKREGVKRFNKTDEKIAIYLFSLSNYYTACNPSQHCVKGPSAVKISEETKRKMSRIIAYLTRIKMVETIDFEKSGIFRSDVLKKDYGEQKVLKKQYPFSFALKKLKELGWIDEKKYWDNMYKPKDNEDPGFNKYSLKISFGEIINELEKRDRRNKNLINRLLKKNEREGLVEALKLLGLRNNVAVTIAYLKTVNEATSHDIEKNTELFNSEISLVIKELKLRNRDWINERNIRYGKGRPYKLYSLKVKFDNIIEILKKEDNKEQHISKLREISKKRRY